MMCVTVRNIAAPRGVFVANITYSANVEVLDVAIAAQTMMKKYCLHIVLDYGETLFCKTQFAAGLQFAPVIG